MHERKPPEPSRPPAPFGVVAATRSPGDIRIGDYLFLDGAYRRVTDMRSDGASRRVLIFADHRPVTVGQSTLVFRPPDSE